MPPVKTSDTGKDNAASGTGVSPTAEQLADALAKRLQQEEVARQQPIVKRETVSAALPLIATTYYLQVARNSNSDGPLPLTYSRLAGIGELSKMEDAPQFTTEQIQNYVGRVYQYFIVQSVALLGYPIQYTSYNQPGSGRPSGTTVHQADQVVIPDEQVYPIEKLNSLWTQIGKSDLYFSPNSGINDWRWRDYKLKTPRGTVISLSDGPSYVVRFERTPDFDLEVKITITGITSGSHTFPRGFQLAYEPREMTGAYTYFTLINMEYKWSGKDRSNVDAYTEWAQGLFAAIKKELLLPD